KFIKTGGIANKILCANGDTTTIDNKLSRTYNGSGGGWIRLCVFPAGASVGNPFIEFKIYSQYNAVQTIRLVPQYTIKGINTVYGIFTAPIKVSSYHDIDNDFNQLFHNHSGSVTSAIYSAQVRFESIDNVTIIISDQSTYYTNRITEMFTQNVVSRVSNGTQIPISYDLANGGVINNMLQVNPTIIYTTQLGQQEISKTNDNALTINPSSLRQADHSVRLRIDTDIIDVIKLTPQNMQFIILMIKLNLLNEYKTSPLTKNSLFLINGIHYIVGAVGSGQTTLMCKLVVIYKKIINSFKLYFSNYKADETMALNLNSKNIQLTNVTYGEAMIFLPEFDEIKYSTNEMYT
ncbi:MAG: hypothetical protein EZS28_028966, partial [Streblomastix strix]